MTANDIADMVEKEPYHTNLNRTTIAYFIRQQQAEIKELEKENTDLRYLIATKLEQQDGISLNSIAHPITNTPEPSYEIDPDKLETIEIESLKQSKSDGNNKVNPQLTQEEILDIWYAMKDDSNNWTRYVDFARAILRKAQE